MMESAILGERKLGMKTAIFSAILTVTSVIAASADSGIVTQCDSTDVQKTIIRKIKDRFGINAGVDKSGAISICNDYLSLPLTEGEPLERIYQFLEQNRDIFQLENPRQELRLRYAYSPPRARIRLVDFSFDQIEVRGGHVGIGLSADSLSLDSLFVIRIGCRIFPQARSVNTTPTIKKEQAIDIALSDTAHTGIPPEIYPNRANVGPDPQLIIQIRDDIPHLVWPVHVYVGGPTYYIDAHTGEVLEVKNETIIN